MKREEVERQLLEVLPFLHDPNPQARQVALANLVPYTVRGVDGRGVFFRTNNEDEGKEGREPVAISDLKKLCREGLAIAHDAWKALVNLSDQQDEDLEGRGRRWLGEEGFLRFVVGYIINPESTLADLAAMLLSNLSGAPEMCVRLVRMRMKVKVQAGENSNIFFVPEGTCGTSPAPMRPSGSSQSSVTEPETETETERAALPLLLYAFSQGAAAPKTRKSSVDFLAGAFANIASVPEGREFFGTPLPSKEAEDGGVEYPLAHLLPFIDHPNVIRRGGVVSTIRNFSFNPRAHRALLAPSTVLVSITSPSSSSPYSSSSNPSVSTPIPASAPGLSALPLLLLPLASSSLTDLDIDLLPPSLQLLPADKTPEPDREIRKMLVETLLLLCHTRWGRGVLRGEKRVVNATGGVDTSENGGEGAGGGGEEAGEWYGGTYHVVRALHETETDEEIAGLIERLVVLLKGVEGHGDEEEKEYDTLPGGDDDGDLLVPPEARLLQGLVSPISGKVASQIQTVDIEKEEEEEEMSLEPLGADSSVALSDEDSDDEKIIEI
ncbi:cytoplasmic protein [Lentinula raphanica]|nr:cytoplasmic protein [Lentinula raphanica]